MKSKETRTMEDTTVSTVFPDGCKSLRNSIQVTADNIKELSMGDVKLSQETIKEMSYNIKKAYRLLEDAKMRLGKAIQAYEGGTSIYKDVLVGEDPFKK
jgi:hypothetical protein